MNPQLRDTHHGFDGLVPASLLVPLRVLLPSSLKVECPWPSLKYRLLTGFNPPIIDGGSGTLGFAPSRGED